MRLDANQLPFRDGECAGGSNDIRHDALAPERFSKPVADLGTMTVGKVIESTSPNQLLVTVSDGEMDGMAVQGGCFGSD